MRLFSPKPKNKSGDEALYFCTTLHKTRIFLLYLLLLLIVAQDSLRRHTGRGSRFKRNCARATEDK
jgi:hypothetical protein